MPPLPPPPGRSPAPLGAVLAGGSSRRFGAPKALAAVGGRPIVERVLGALRGVVPEVVVVANEPGLFAHLGVPVHPDDVPGLGPLGGVRTALRLATAAGRPGALCLACDLPFITAAVVELLREHAAAHPGRIVAPESHGRRGVEPLCAAYPAECAGALDAALAAGERQAVALLAHYPVQRVPLSEVRRAGDPAVVFFNVNTAEDLRRAERIAADLPHDGR